MVPKTVGRWTWWQSKANGFIAPFYSFSKPPVCLGLTFTYFSYLSYWHWTDAAPVCFCTPVTFLWCVTDELQEGEIWKTDWKANTNKDILSALRWPFKCVFHSSRKWHEYIFNATIWIHWNPKNSSVLICTVRPDAAGKIFLFLPGGSRQSGLSLGCGKERLPPPAIHYLKCVCCRQWAPNIQMHDGKDCCKQRFKREALTGHY